MFKLLLFPITILLSFFITAQTPGDIHSNTSLIRNFTPQNYGANPQTFSTVQDHRGVMYFACQQGVLEYDGVSWNIIKTKEHTVLKLAIDEKGIIHVLCEEEYGVINVDTHGTLYYESRMELFRKYKNSSFDKFEEIAFLGESTYLLTSDNLYQLKNNQVEQMKTESEVVFLGKNEEELFVQLKDHGLFTVLDGKITPYDSSELFNGMNLVAITNFNGQVIGISNSGNIIELPSGASISSTIKLNDYKISSVINNRDLNLILGTFSGIVILNKEFQVIKTIGIAEGLIDETITSLFLDQEDNLWTTTQIGINKVEIDSPIEFFNKKNLLKGSLEAVEGFNNSVYCASQNGLYYLRPDGNMAKLRDFNVDIYGLTAMKFGSDSLLIISEVDAVYQMDRNNKVTKLQNGGPWDVCRSPVNPNDLFVVNFNGISKISYQNGKLNDVGYNREFAEAEPFNFIIENNGTIWMGTEKNGVYRTNVATYLEVGSYVYYDTLSGLPTGACFMFEDKERILVGTSKGLYEYKDDAFFKSDTYNLRGLSKLHGIHRMKKDKKGNIWAVLYDEQNNYEIGFLTEIEGKYHWKKDAFIKYAEEVVHDIYFDDEGFTWLAGPNGLIKFDNNYKKEIDKSYTCLIRQITFGDSTLFGGFLTEEQQFSLQSLEIKYSSNIPITFEFSSSSYINENVTQYSYILEGHNKNWSNWSPRTLKEFQLKEGDYVFKVKARNINGVESNITSYSITILPPWYRTWWAYVFYGILLVLVIYGIIKLSTNRIKQQNIRLESIVKERTIEVVAQKAEAEKQRDIADQRNEEILDSINYAKRIQNAILPPEKLIKEHLKDSFVLYKPKDVVAGDFYWLEPKDGIVIFAAADCTGHGVPGAMVSVICNNALNRSVREHCLIEPGEILTKTREIVIQEFEKSEEEVKDGMDIALCSLKGMKLQYAGAHNPLWIIRNGEIIETKANKQPIGQFDKLEPYTSHFFDLQSGDGIYIFSDGYVDQFGGENGKKFKAKALRALLLSIQDKDMEEQKFLIDQEFEKWKGDLEQIDDVCMIGVRV